MHKKNLHPNYYQLMNIYVTDFQTRRDILKLSSCHFLLIKLTSFLLALKGLIINLEL